MDIISKIDFITKIDFMAIGRYAVNMKVFLWFTGSFWTRLLFLIIFAAASMVLYFISKHSGEEKIGEKLRRFSDFDFNFLNTLSYSVAKTFRRVFFLGLFIFGVCLFFNPSITYWSYITITALILFLTSLRLLLNIREKTNFLRPAWKHTDYSKREKAIDKIFSERILIKIALKDKDKDVRKAAVNKITNEAALEKVALNDEFYYVRQIAVSKITNEALLEMIALNDKDEYVRKIAVSKITNEAVLEKVALNEKNEDVRTAAVSKITSESVLANIVSKYPRSSYFRHVILIKINNPDVLLTLAGDGYMELSNAAAIKLAELGDQRAVDFLILGLGARSRGDKTDDYTYSGIRDKAARALKDLFEKYPELDTQVMGKRITGATYSQYTDHHDSSWACRD